MGIANVDVFNKVKAMAIDARNKFGMDDNSKRAGKITIGTVIKHRKPPVKDFQSPEAVVLGVEINPTTNMVTLMHVHLQQGCMPRPASTTFPLSELNSRIVILGDVSSWTPVSAEKQAACDALKKAEAAVADLRAKLAAMK